MTIKKLFQSGFAYTLGNLLVQGLSFITLPIYTRLLTKEVYGQFNLYMAWVGIVTLFIGLQTAGSFSSARIKFKSDYDEYAISAFTVSNIFFIIVFLCAYLLKQFLANLLGLTPINVVILVVQSYTTYVAMFFGQYFIQKQKVLLNLCFSFFNAFVNIVMSIILIHIMENTFMARVLGNIIPTAIVTIIALIYLYTRKYSLFKVKYLKFILLVSIPLIFHLLGHQLLNQLDRIMLGKLISLEHVAIYSFGYNIGLVIQIVLNSMNTIWIPWYFDSKRSNKVLKRSIAVYLSIGIFFTLGYLTIFPELVLLLGGVKYEITNQFIALIVISYFIVFLYTFPVNIQFYHANTKMIPFGTHFASGANFILNMLLIPIYGVYGAAIATIISYCFLLLFHHLIAKKMYKYSDVKGATYILLILLVSIYGGIMTFFIHQLIIRWIFGCIVIVTYSIYYKKEINMIFKTKILKKRLNNSNEWSN